MYRHVVQCLCVVMGGVVLVGLLQCSQVDRPGVCKYDNDCKAENSRCVFNDSLCAVNVGQCEGVCKVSEVPENTCACKQDEDCNYPFEGCAGCRCYKRDVLTCQTDADCGRGRLCVGDGNKRICEVRTACEKDENCLNGYVCREKSCCNLASGRCPGQCKTGSPCQDDVDCLVCNLSCKNGLCGPQGPSCSGVKCEKDADCTTCGGKCAAGYCQINNTTPGCVGKVCGLDADCATCGAVCRNGTCQTSSNPGCSTTSCVTDTDCQGTGLTSCLSGCCR